MVCVLATLKVKADKAQDFETIFKKLSEDVLIWFAGDSGFCTIGSSESDII